MKSKSQSIPSPPLSYQSQAQAVLVPTEMSVVDLRCVTLERLGCGYYCWWEHMVWVVWQAKPWQKSLKASADAATAQTSKWWHNCHCCSDATCFTVMTAMPFPKRLVAKQNPSLIPTDTRECEHTHTKARMAAQAYMCTQNQVRFAFHRSLSCVSNGVKPAGKGTATGEPLCSLLT